MTSTYKSSGGEVYPVRDGQTWQVFTSTGHHVFHCSDLMQTQEFDGLLLDWADDPTLVYADPPWTPAMIAQYRTKSGLEKASYDWATLHQRILGLVAPGTPVYMEGAVSHSGALQDVLPGPIKASWAITYYGRRGAVLHYSGATPPPEGSWGDLVGADDEHTPGIVMGLYPPGLVLDPVAGRGGTARHAHKRGWSSLNNEMNPWRMSAALHSLARLTGDTPTRIN